VIDGLRLIREQLVHQSALAEIPLGGNQPRPRRGQRPRHRGVRPQRPIRCELDPSERVQFRGERVLVPGAELQIDAGTVLDRPGSFPSSGARVPPSNGFTLRTPTLGYHSDCQS
jgi:hypothetical protein